MQPLVKLDRVSMAYGRGGAAVRAVEDVSLEIAHGEFIAVVGPSGCGKSSLMKLISGLHPPAAGTFAVEGRPVTGPLRSVGMAFQNSNLLPWRTALDNVLLPLEIVQPYRKDFSARKGEFREKARSLLEAVGLAGFAEKFPWQLSGGMQQRTSICRALVHEPEIVILDEPEAGLDPQSRVRVREYILGLAHTKTIILTTHNMDEADRVVDRLAIIDHGVLLVVDTPAALKQQVGPGDVVEIKLTDASDGEALERVCRQLGEEVGTASYSSAGRSITLRALHAAARLPIILEALNSAGIAPGEVSLRPNSLEDVFISLVEAGRDG